MQLRINLDEFPSLFDDRVAFTVEIYLIQLHCMQFIGTIDGVTMASWVWMTPNICDHLRRGTPINIEYHRQVTDSETKNQWKQQYA